jgi:hypothetical protein
LRRRGKKLVLSAAGGREEHTKSKIAEFWNKSASFGIDRKEENTVQVQISEHL